MTEDSFTASYTGICVSLGLMHIILYGLNVTFGCIDHIVLLSMFQIVFSKRKKERNVNNKSLKVPDVLILNVFQHAIYEETTVKQIYRKNFISIVIFVCHLSSLCN
jgi:hypothetical protein